MRCSRSVHRLLEIVEHPSRAHPTGQWADSLLCAARRCAARRLPRDAHSPTLSLFVPLALFLSLPHSLFPSPSRSLSRSLSLFLAHSICRYRTICICGQLSNDVNTVQKSGTDSCVGLMISNANVQNSLSWSTFAWQRWMEAGLIRSKIKPLSSDLRILVHLVVYDSG